jgi:hypothetical protein
VSIEVQDTQEFGKLKPMIKKLSFSLMTLALAAASAASTYKVTLFQPSLINGTELKPGEYKIELKDNKAIISGRKQSVEAPVTTETAGTKFSSTTVRYHNGDGKYRLQEIHIGGTNTKLVFSN